MITENYNSIFDNLTNEEFEQILKDCGFKFTKVDGKGGLYINGDQVTSEALAEEYDAFKLHMEYNHKNKYSSVNTLSVSTENKIFDELDNCSLAA